MAALSLHWLAPRKAASTPVSFGTPWARGTLWPADPISMQDDSGRNYPVQTKVNAYWPDGSVKWLLHSGVLDADRSYRLSKGKQEEPPSGIVASQDRDGSVSIESDLLSCRIQKGDRLITSLQRKRVAQKPLSAQLLAYIENREEQEETESISIHKLIGCTEKITLEETGPLRAVIKLEGYHNYVSRGGGMFPFVIRLYVYANSDEIRMTHTFIYNADENKDFLKGLAVEFDMHASGELWNRHIGFTGDSGMFYEAAQSLFMHRKIHPSYEQQIEGRLVTIDPLEDETLLQHAKDNASWSTFRLQQNSSDQYNIVKSTRQGCACIPAAQGNRSKGAAFFGSESLILSVAVKDFWQKSPMALEVSDATADKPRLTVWLWSKYAEAFDFRAYDTVQHPLSYGDINNDPKGIANTNELVIKLFDHMPGKKAVLDFADDVQTDSLLIADVHVYEETQVFGTYWCMPKDECFKEAAHEKALLGVLEFVMEEVEQRRWYGFWDYGDVMHSYDPVRHCWRYDVVGYAWHNTELCNTYYNWLAFLRTGDYAIYRFARAMTRHTSEVDTYHQGKYAMLGSRHNVRHWGCKWKEPRISMAGHHRFFYYLTGDDRIGDIMAFVKDADHADRSDMVGKVNGLELVRTGPDWSSYVSNWMTQWERFNDIHYRDKILTGIASIKQAPLRLTSGSHFLYEPATGVMNYYGDGTYQYHMVICFGGPEIWFELADLVEDEEFKDMLAQFGDYYAMTPAERKAASHGIFNDSNEQSWEWPGFGIRMIAYAGYRNADKKRMQQAIDMLGDNPGNSSVPPGQMDGEGNPVLIEVEATEYIRPIREFPGVHTNGLAQWSLNYMETARLRELMKM